jgi:hypothetical protein
MKESVVSFGGALRVLGDFHATNLATLRDALLKNKVPFDISNYYHAEHGIEWEITLDQFEGLKALVGGKHEHCGTSACAVGWAPVFIGLSKEDLDENNRLNYREYSDKYLVPLNCKWWSYLFSEAWAYIDNTAHGAAYRINQLVTSQDEFPPFNIHTFDDECCGDPHTNPMCQEYIEMRNAWLKEQGVL